MTRQQEFTIIVIGLMITVGTIMVIMGYIYGPLLQHERYRANIFKDCMEMNKGDNWTGGYNTKLQERCYNL